LITLAASAAVNHAWAAATSLGMISAMLGLLIYDECALAMNYWRRAVNEYVGQDPTRYMLPSNDSKFILSGIQSAFKRIRHRIRVSRLYDFARGMLGLQIREKKSDHRAIAEPVARAAHRTYDPIVDSQEFGGPPSTSLISSLTNKSTM
jgi:hypothetical protein